MVKGWLVNSVVVGPWVWAAEARGATALTPTLGRWFPNLQNEEPYVSEQWKLTQYLRDAVGWYQTGEVRVHVSTTVDGDAQSLQAAFDSFGQMNVGKVAVRVEGKL